MFWMFSSWWVFFYVFFNFFQYKWQLTNAGTLESSLIMDSKYGWQTMLQINTQRNKIILHMSCISNVWFGIGFGSNEMNNTYAIVVDGNGTVMERQWNSQNNSIDLSANAMIEVVKSTLVSDTSKRHWYRYVIIERNITNTNDSRYYSFPTVTSIIPTIYARGNTSYLSNYIFKEAQNMTLENVSCSALRSYVQIQEETLLSSMALFGPLQYPTILEMKVTTFSTDAELKYCTQGFDTTLNQSIVLLPRGGNCTEHQKALLAEAAGAAAVLIYNNEDINMVEEIVEDDGNLSEIQIPIRMISQASGWNIKASSNVTITLQCFDEKYPTTLCMTDINGDHWSLDGNYQLQAQSCKDCNPYWKRTGIPGIVEDAWLFLGSNSSRWEVFYSQMHENYVRAFCNDTLTSPDECKKWYVYNSQKGIFEHDTNILMSAALCNIATNHICVQASNTCAAGLKGRYHQFTNNAGLWTREMSSQDMTSGFLIWGQWTPENKRRLFDFESEGRASQIWDDLIWGFEMVDTYQQISVAYCQWGTIEQIGGEEAWNIAKNHPENCPEWFVLKDCNTPNFEYVADPHFSITETCSTSNNSNHNKETNEHIPTHICMSELGSSYHVFLEGDYMMIENMSTASGRKVWSNTRLENTNFPAYLWYYGDNYPHFRMWVIADALPSSTHTIGIYGYCFADTDSPIECRGCWNFYEPNCFTAMCDIQTYEGICDSTTAPPDSVYPETLCVQSQDVKALTMTGSYSILNLQDYDRPAWKHVENDQTWYIYYDNTLRFWKIGTSFTNALYFCMNNIYWDPAQCLWTTSSGDLTSITVESNGVCPNALNTDGESENEDSSTTTKTDETKSDESDDGSGVIVGVVTACVVLIVIGCLWYCFRSQNQNNRFFQKQKTKKSEPIDGTGKRVLNALELGKTQWETINADEPDPQQEKHDPEMGVPETEQEKQKKESDDESSDDKDIR